MPKKRYRKRYKRRYKSRKTMSMKSCCPKPEIKYCDVSFNDQTILNSDYHGSAIDFIPGTSNYLSNILTYISAGTARNQRIGSKITLKAIRWTFQIWPCLDATTIITNYVVVRIIIGSWNNAAASTVPNALAYANNYIFSLPLNRELYNFSYDKILNRNFGWTTSATGTGAAGGGVVTHTHYQRFKNREVIYSGTVPKHEEDQFSLAMIGTMVSPTLAAATPLYCVNGRFRIYYTDS